MKIFKFGGASIKDATSVRNVVQIVKKHHTENPILVVSAAGKTTNMLEAVVHAYYHQNADLDNKLQIVKDYHTEIMRGLFTDNEAEIYDEINDVWVDLSWTLEEQPHSDYDYVYDQIVSIGEILSTKIVAAFLNQEGAKAHWLDVRDCIRTDNTYRDAVVDWDETIQHINAKVPPLRQSGLVVTQGFLGGTTENFTTTLGREGSDYTAAIFSYCLNADAMVIWKDVPGVLTADPRLFPDATLMEQVSYQEAIEMTYYGAQVIHPKTIRPLQNKGIALYVKSFVNPDGQGTVINAQEREDYPTMLVVKTQQALLKIVSKGFYFVDERRFAQLFNTLADYRIKVNMTQNTALAFSVCVNDAPERIEAFCKAVATDYEVEKISGLQLLTIRYGNPEIVQKLSSGRTILLEEHIKKNTQLLMANS